MANMMASSSVCTGNAMWNSCAAKATSSEGSAKAPVMGCIAVLAVVVLAAAATASRSRSCSLRAASESNGAPVAVVALLAAAATASRSCSCSLQTAPETN